jgi:hypothetical protein
MLATEIARNEEQSEPSRFAECWEWDLVNADFDLKFTFIRSRNLCAYLCDNSLCKILDFSFNSCSICLISHGFAILSEQNSSEKSVRQSGKREINYS